MFLRALNLAKIPVLIAIFVTPIRFFLELAGLPENVIFIIGLLWLTLAIAVYWGIKLYNEKQPYLLLLLSLIIFSPVSRFTVFVVWWRINSYISLNGELGVLILRNDFFEMYEGILGINLIGCLLSGAYIIHRSAQTLIQSVQAHKTH